MIIGILKEPAHERRVAMLPAELQTLIKQKIDIIVEKDAGQSASADNAAYEQAGATVGSRADILAKADMIFCINPLNSSDVSALKEKTIVFGMFSPYDNIDLIKQIRDKGLSCFSLEFIPRTSRAQSMDVLSSMATVAGYKAVLTAATTLPRFFPMFMTAAGTITPAKMLVLGAGVAGLQSIATGRRLGAVVEAFDVRAAVKEEVQSLGAKFVEVEGAKDDKAAGGYAVEQTEEFKRKQQEAIHNSAVKSDVIICTAQIPGRKAPVLITKETVAAMKPGSVIIDLAASSGGNCEGSQNNETVVVNGITIIGNSFFPSTLPTDASKMYGKNIINLLKIMVKDGVADLNFEDDIIAGTCIAHDKKITNARIAELAGN